MGCTQLDRFLKQDTKLDRRVAYQAGVGRLSVLIGSGKIIHNRFSELRFEIDDLHRNIPWLKKRLDLRRPRITRFFKTCKKVEAEDLFGLLFKKVGSHQGIDAPGKRNGNGTGHSKKS